MSVIVKGVKMPETCEECTYQTKGACFASRVNEGTIIIRRTDEDRPKWCPLVEIKTPHGDLIVRDALPFEYVQEVGWEGQMHLVVRSLPIKEAPVIVEAEGK